MPEEDLPGQPPPNSTNGDLYVDPMSQRTKEAAAHASRQLDELMASLQQLKVNDLFYLIQISRVRYFSSRLPILVSTATTSK